MSTKLVGQVWDYVLTSNERAVLQAYAEHANHATNVARPGLRLVAWMTDLHLTTGRRIVRGFVARGVFLLADPPSQHRATAYAIRLSRLAAKDPYVDGTGRVRGTTTLPLTRNPGVANARSRGSTEVAPRYPNLVNPHIEQDAGTRSIDRGRRGGLRSVGEVLREAQSVG